MSGKEATASAERTMRIVLAKPGLDGHDRGIRLVGRALRDAGMEVIYLKFVTLDSVVETAVQEDADAVGVSFLTGSHRMLLPDLVERLRAQGCDHMVVTAGGIIPKQDFGPLQEQGVDAVFGPGTPAQEIVATISELIASRREQAVH